MASAPTDVIATAPSSRRSGPRRGLRVTREGRFFVLVTIGVGAAAVNTGNNLLYLVLGLLLSLILVSGVLSDLVLLDVEGERRLPLRAFAGGPALVEIVLRNTKRRLPSFSLEVEDEAVDLATDRRCYFLKVEANGEQRAAYRRELPRRGRVRFASLRISTRYPFGLFDKWRVLDLAGELLVFPHIDASARAPELATGGEGALRAIRGPGIEPADLRDYRVGDEARSLHARRSAALGRLIVRERERETSSALRIALETAIDLGSEAQRAALERAISKVAGMAIDAHERGATVEIVTRSARSARVLPTGSIDPLLTFLALLDPIAIDGAPALDVARADVVVGP
jgi:uncharacterized protein (DUF58 family)